MAGRGPAPKKDHSRERDDKNFTKLVSSDEPMGFELPDDVLPQIKVEGELQWDVDGNPIREEWHPATRRWWEAWRMSPQASRMLSEPDWHFLLETALIHHKMWNNGRWEFASEVRLRAAKFGATPEDRMRLRSEIEVPDKYPVGEQTHNGMGATVTKINDRRKRISGGTAGE